MKIKTSELTGAALDWAVAVCEGLPIRHDPMNFGPAVAEGGFWIWDERGPIGKRDYRLIGRQYSPSNNWSQGGPLIERERITVIHTERWDTDKGHVPLCAASKGPHSPTESYEHVQMVPTYIIGADDSITGPTPLIAAMRAFVASKLGDEVDIPTELS